MLTVRDLEKLQKYLNVKKVVNLEVKEYQRKNKKAIREIMIEYADGIKVIGDLNEDNFTMNRVDGLTSISKHFARGKYGQSKWRGNFSGLFLKSLLEFYKPKYVIDGMVGSGTTKEVCNDLGILNECYDLNPKWGGFDALNQQLQKSSDFIVWHPPYMAFKGSNMPRYSGIEWGTEKHTSDGSHIEDTKEFTKWLNIIQANFYTALRRNGRMAILCGDSRFKGQYYSMFKEMDIYGSLEQVIIKEQFNTTSGDCTYKGKFIPIAHEYCLIIRKTDNFIIPCKIIKNIDIDIRNEKTVTWRALIKSIIESKGKISRKDLYNILEKHPKSKNNNNVKAKARQILNSFDDFVSTGDIYSLRPLKTNA